MRCMSRNKVSFWYALYEGTEPVVDENGFETGEKIVKYSNPCEFRANISSAVGDSSVELFGVDLQYDKRIAMDNSRPPIDEYSILWVDRKPELDDSGRTKTPHDYIVTKVAPSLNSALVAIKKVNAGG